MQRQDEGRISRHELLKAAGTAVAALALELRVPTLAAAPQPSEDRLFLRDFCAFLQDESSSIPAEEFGKGPIP